MGNRFASAGYKFTPPFDRSAPGCDERRATECQFACPGDQDAGLVDNLAVERTPFVARNAGFAGLVKWFRDLGKRFAGRGASIAGSEWLLVRLVRLFAVQEGRAAMVRS